MEIDRPFRILKASQKEAEKARKNDGSEAASDPINVQLRKDIQGLERTAEAARERMENPNEMERRCQLLEKTWSEKLEKEGAKHLVEGMKEAVDAVRTEQKPDLTFTMEKPSFKLTAEATRRIAHTKIKDRDI